LQWFFAAISEADIDSILTIEKLSFQRPWGRISFLNELALESAVNLAVKRKDDSGQERIIAYVFFRLVVDEMHILKIAVSPDWRCRGIATVLMNKCLELAEDKGINAVYLEVRPSNTAAVLLYHKIGFQIVAKRIGYYTETGEDALVMSKKLREVV